MNSIHDSFMYFWECITGVLEDNKARMLRLATFVTLLIGMIWAAWNYFEASTISNTNEEGSYLEAEMRVQQAAAQRENQTLKKIAEVAAAVNTMRNGGLAIAESMNGMNRRLFNIDGFNDFGMEDISGTGTGTGDSFVDAVNATASNPAPTQQEQQEVQLSVKAVMLSDKSKIAIVDTGGKKGVIIRVGSELPGGVGRVVRIKPNGLTVRNQITRQEKEYLIK
ncbi:MAG: hypothetical protein IJS42_03315 [Synergistaceae bacterium]|nr:hypothetical protein [Synergistaceae bacterium]